MHSKVRLGSVNKRLDEAILFGTIVSTAKSFYVLVHDEIRVFEKNFTRLRPMPGPLASGALVEAYIACLYSNQTMDKTVTMLRFTNKSSIAAVS